MEKFRKLWDEKWEKGNAGDLYLSAIFDSPEVRKSAQDDFFRELLGDSLGFAGAKMIR